MMRTNFKQRVVLGLVMAAFLTAHAQLPAWGYKNNRIAVTSDGNSARDNEYKWPTGDPDDWGATAATLGIIAKLGLQDKLVHYSYNNFIDAPAGPDNKNQMKISADGAISRWHYDDTKFYDVTTQLAEARSNLAAEMAKSTASDPLYLILAGLSEFLYQAVDEVVKQGHMESLSHVYLISHSGFNENEKRRDWHHTWDDAQARSGHRIHYKKIQDQNDKTNPHHLWHSGSDFSVWYWMRDHEDETVRWMYSRLVAHSGHVADISDCGLLFYLLWGDADGSPSKFKAFIGEGILTEKAFDADDSLYEAFKNPSAQARPFVRWWWNGNCITKKEILRELDLLKAAGIGGVEINPIAMHEQADSQGIAAVPWLSDQWNKLAKVAVDGARQRGMVADMIVGSGWPFGGQFLSPDETIKGIKLKKMVVQGPQDYTGSLADLKIAKRGTFQASDIPEEVQFIRLIPEALEDIGQCQDLTPHVTAQGQLQFHVPPGQHTLVVGWLQQRFRDVMHGAPGADGPVLDHYNRQAVETYLNRMSQNLGPVLGGKLGPSLRAMFCDSIELSGANWTQDLPQAFKERRGYDLDPYLPFVLDAKLPAGSEEVLDRLKRARYDFSRTLVELFRERFIRPYHEWCHANGTLSRYQAYGHPWLMGMLDGYLIPDIPEGDTWLYNNWQAMDNIRYAVWNKYAASGGHLADRSLIGCEAITNTSGVFRANLAYIKQACDLSFITGVNHLILHGFNYSPPEIPFPGWIRYGTYLNENNPWWPDFKYWADYSARISQVLQMSRAKIEIAILGPEADIWSEYGLDRSPFVHEPDYLHYLWQAIHQNGCSADYISETILQQGKVQGGKLHFGPMAYTTLMLASVQSLEPSSAQTLAEFATQGGTLICIDQIPHRSPAMAHAGAQDAQVKALFAQIMGHKGQNVHHVKAPQIKTLTQWTGRILDQATVSRSVRIDPPDERLFQIHHQVEGRDIFFFVNMHQDRALSFQTSFDIKGKTPWQWHPETGQRSVADVSQPLQLDPLESLLLVFDRKTGVPQPAQRLNQDVTPRTLSGPWTLELRPVQGEPWQHPVTELFDLGQSRDTRFNTFGGTLVYKMEFDCHQSWDLLDLGQVFNLAQVTLNGKDLGIRWWGPRRFEITGSLRMGHNHLEIRVPTVLVNYCRSLKDNPMAQVWTQKQPHNESMGMTGPVQLHAYTK